MWYIGQKEYDSGREGVRIRRGDGVTHKREVIENERQGAKCACRSENEGRG